MGKAPYHGKAWLSEKEIGDYIWEKGLLEEAMTFGDGQWFREPNIANGLSPDFVFVGDEIDWSADTAGTLKRPSIAVVELKITADASSIIQLIHYANLIRMHSNGWAHRNRSYPPTINFILIARYFDKSCAPFLELPGINFVAFRANVANDKSVTLEFENVDTPFHSTEEFDEILQARLPVRGIHAT
jgi:hypothetical protein